MKVAVEGAGNSQKKLQLQKVDSFEDLLKQTQKDTTNIPTPATNRAAKKKKKKAPHASTFEHEDENLGGSSTCFWSLTWCCFDVQTAESFWPSFHISIKILFYFFTYKYIFSGDDFEATPWLPPSIEKAAQFKNNTIFRNGDVRLDSINVIQAPDLGNGVTLYFQVI